jgi:hydroxypyruvate isomerase
MRLRAAGKLISEADTYHSQNSFEDQPMPSINRRDFLGAAVAGTAAMSAFPQSLRSEEQVTQNMIGKTPHTRFAVNVEMWWTKLPFLDRIRQAAELGFPAVEFWPFQNKDLPAIAKLCEELKIEVSQFTAWGFSPGMNNPKNEDDFVATIEEACQAAKVVKARKMCVVAGDNQPGMTQDQMLAQVTKALKRAAPVAEKHQVMLILEPMNGRVDHPGHCLYGSTDALRICREVDSPMVKINWDLYHMQITEGDLCGHMREGFDQIGYLQLADHPGRHEPGTGEIHYNRVLKEAFDLGYRDYVGLECSPKTTELAAAKGVAAADVW